MNNFNGNDHPRDRDGKFTNANGGSGSDDVKEQIAWARKNGKELPLNADGSLDTFKLGKMFEENGGKSRVKVGEITSPIYDNMVLSNGRRVKDIVTRAVEMPLTGPVGAEHIEEHDERKGLVSKYKGFMSDIINDPDYVFEDKRFENSLDIEKKIDKHTMMVVSLNFDNPDYTNTLITMREEGERKFDTTVKSFGNLKKVLYKKPET